METKISTSDLNLYYGNNHALKYMKIRSQRLSDRPAAVSLPI